MCTAKRKIPTSEGFFLFGKHPLLCNCLHTTCFVIAFTPLVLFQFFFFFSFSFLHLLNCVCVNPQVSLLAFHLSPASGSLLQAHQQVGIIGKEGRVISLFSWSQGVQDHSFDTVIHKYHPGPRRRPDYFLYSPSYCPKMELFCSFNF